MRVRQTDFMEKKADRAAALAGDLTKNPEVASYLYMLAAALAEHLGFQDHPLYTRIRERDPEWETIPKDERMPRFAAGIQRCVMLKMPALFAVFEENIGPYLHQVAFKVLEDHARYETMRQALFQASRQAVQTEPQIARLPDNPIQLDTDRLTGKLRTTIPDTATTAHLLEIASLHHARKPARPPGRPKGLGKPKKSGQPSVPPEEALRAYSMHSEGAHWREIAKALWPSMKPAALRSDATRLKVRYRIERGDRITRRKNRE